MIFHKLQRICWQIELDGNVVIQIVEKPHVVQEWKKRINIGVASHITAASKGGPRYDENMTAQERKSSENGIWLCQSCSKLIDSDVKRYTIDKLKKWKELSEQMAVLDLEEAVVSKSDGDKELIKFFIQCFDRPAFHDRICQEGRIEDFDKTMRILLLH